MFKRLNQQGFGALAVILIIVIVGIIGGTGWYVYKANVTTEKAQDESAAHNPSTSNNSISSASWRTYTNDEYSFSFNLPSDVAFNEKNNGSIYQQEKDLGLAYSVQRIQDINENEPYYLDKKTALNDIEALKIGNVSTQIGLTGYYKLIDFQEEDVYGKKGIAFQNVKSCDSLTLLYQAYIYTANYRIIITYSVSNMERIIEANRKYFTDYPECTTGALKLNSVDFYNDLVAGKTDPISQKWFTDFDKIITSIKFN